MIEKGKRAIRRYVSQTRAGILESMTFRASLFISLIGNLIYMVVLYYLWQAIFASSESDTVNGMTFRDTFVYLTMAGAIFSTLEVYLVWKMGREIQSGEFALHFVRPTDYFLREFFYVLGNVVIQLALTLIPTFVVVGFLVEWQIPLGINLLFFAISLLFSLLLNFCLDFIVGTMCMYTQAFWGINMVKEVIIMILSGATVPIAFFPMPYREIATFLPFQAMYNLPLEILISRDMGIDGYVRSIGIQILWVILLTLIGRLFFRRSSRIITVNGG